MVRLVSPSTATLVAGLAVVAGLTTAVGLNAVWAADSEKDAKTAFDKVVADPRADEKAIAAACDRLANAEPPKGAEALMSAVLDKDDRRLVTHALSSLARVKDPRAAKAIAKELEQQKDARNRRLLAEACIALAGEEPTKALLKTLGAKEDAVRFAAATALGGRAGQLKTVRSPLQTHLKTEKNPRVRAAIRTSLARLGDTGTKPADAVEWRPDGTSKSFEVARVVFCIDDSIVARERNLGEPHAPVAPGTPAPPGDTAPVATPTKAAAKKPTRKAQSAYEIAGGTVASALVRLADESSFELMTFGQSVRTFGRGKYTQAKGKAVDEAASWLKQKEEGALGRGREALRAVRDAIELDPTPDEVFLFTTGMPDTRDIVAETRAVADLAWQKGVVVHTVGLQLPESGSTDSEREKLERKRADADFGMFLSTLATQTGGHTHTVVLETFKDDPAKPEAKPDPTARGPQPQPGPAPAPGDKGVIKLDKNKKVPRDEVAKLKKRFEEALKAKDAAAAEVIEAIAACGDDALFELTQRALESPDPEVVDAAVAGFATNPDADQRKALARELEKERDPGKALAYARALMGQKVPDVTKLLVQEAGRRDGANDVARILLGEIARRSADEIAAVGSADINRAIKNRTGLTGHAAATILSKLKKEATSDADFEIERDRFLPAKFPKHASVAFVLDIERDAMERPFFVPGPPPAPPPGKDKKPVKPAEPEPPISRLAAMKKDAQRAAEAVAIAEGKLNVIRMGDGNALGKRVSALPGLGRQAREWIASLSTESLRDPLAALEAALDDPDVEAIYVVTAGLPARASESTGAILQKLRSRQRTRRVPVHVVAALGQQLKGSDPEKAAAERKDLEAQLAAFWTPIANECGGTYQLRTDLRGLETPKAPAKPGK